MTRAGIFLDTGVFVAAVSPRDPYHEAAHRILEHARGSPRAVTSDYVLAEAWNYIRRRIRRPEPARIVRRLAFGDRDVPPLVTSVVRIHSGRFAAALDRFERHFDAGLSFTDWTNLVAMHDEALDTIATFDKGFDAWATVWTG